jgi:hypothetical protein
LILARNGLIAICLVWLGASWVHANDVIPVKVEGSGEGPNSIQWKPEATAVFMRVGKTGSAAKAQIQGSLPDSDWSVLHGTRPIVVGKKDFTFPLTLISPVSTIEVVLIDPLGNAYPQRVKFTAPDWNHSVEALQVFQLQRSTLGVALGPASINFQQTDVPTYTQTAISVTAFYTRPLSIRMDGNLTVFGTALPLSSSRNDVKVRIFGLNARLGYNPLRLKHPWYLSLMGGVYYNTMMTTPSVFGYRNVAGPQLYPLIRYRMNNRSSISTFLKFSPVSRKGFDFLGLSSYEASTGVTYGTPLGGTTGMVIAANYSHLKLALPELGASLTLKTISFSVGITY